MLITGECEAGGHLSAGRDIAIAGAQVAATGTATDANPTAGDLVASAGGKLTVTPVEGHYEIAIARGGNFDGRTSYSNESSTTNQLAQLTAAHDLTLVAQGDVALTGATASAGRDVAIQGANVTIAAAKDRVAADVQNVSDHGYSHALSDVEMEQHRHGSFRIHARESASFRWRHHRWCSYFGDHWRWIPEVCCSATAAGKEMTRLAKELKTVVYFILFFSMTFAALGLFVELVFLPALAWINGYDGYLLPSVGRVYKWVTFAGIEIPFCTIVMWLYQRRR